VVAYRSPSELKLWFEIDRHREGGRGMLASLLGLGKLQRELVLPLDFSAKQAGEKVLGYLEETT